MTSTRARRSRSKPVQHLAWRFPACTLLAASVPSAHVPGWDPAGASPTVPGRTWYVSAANCPGPGSGTLEDPFCTIAEPLGLAQPGDTVRVAAGVYRGHLQLVSGVDLLGEDAATTIIRESEAGDVVSAIDVVDVRFAGFTVTGARSGGALPGGAGVFVNLPSSSLVIEDVIARGNDFGIAVFNGFGRSGPNILNCEVHDNAFYGVDCPSGVLSGSLIHRNRIGVSIQGGSTMAQVVGNTIWGNSSDGLLYWDDRAPTLRDNVFAANGGFGIREFAPGTFVNPLVENNLFWDNALGNYFDVQSGTVKNTAAEINAQGNAENNLVDDPLLCAPPARFEVCATSPTLGAGFNGGNIGAAGSGCGAPFQSYGAGLAGSGGFVPTLTPSGCSTSGLSVVLAVDQGLAGAFGVLAGSTTQTALPFFGGTLLLGLPFLLQLPHVLQGMPGVAGQGSALLSLPVPDDPALLGTVVFFQAGYRDAGAPSGVSLSAGVSGTIQ